MSKWQLPSVVPTQVGSQRFPWWFKELKLCLCLSNCIASTGLAEALREEREVGELVRGGGTWLYCQQTQRGKFGFGQ
jgi:hypothetical protein